MVGCSDDQLAYQSKDGWAAPVTGGQRCIGSPLTLGNRLTDHLSASSDHFVIMLAALVIILTAFLHPLGHTRAMLTKRV